jgi:hypothetical protein
MTLHTIAFIFKEFKGSMNVVFQRLGFAIQKGLVVQLVARLSFV